MGIIQSQFDIGSMIIEIKMESKRQENERELAKLYEEQGQVRKVYGARIAEGRRQIK